MKILIIAGGFLPAKKYGGPVISINNLCNLLHENIEIFIIAEEHDLGEKNRLNNIKKGWNKRNNSFVYYLSPKEHNIKSLLELYKEIKPDLIYINSFFDYSLTIPFLKIAKKEKCKVLIAMRGQLCKGAFKKKYKKFPYIFIMKILGLLKNVYYQSTSEEETNAIKKYLCNKENRIFFLTNVPSIPNKNYLKKKKEKGEVRFIFLSRIVAKKNLLLVIELISKIKGKIKLDIYGPIEDKLYWVKCQNEIKKLPSNITINYCGMVNYTDVHEIFSQYDFFIFPTQSENFGHVIAESLIVGTPVIISDRTPFTDINEANGGWAISLQNLEKYEKIIQKIIDLDYKTYQKISENAKTYINKKLNINIIKKKYEEIFNFIVQKDKNYENNL